MSRPSFPFLVIVLAATSGLAVFGAYAEQAERTVTVVGEGVIRTEPDMAVVRIGVETFDSEIENALAENRQRMNALLDALAAAGIGRQDIQTAFYNVFYERPPERPPAESAAGTYRVSNVLSVITRDLERLGAILDSAIGAGANQVWGVEFTVSEPETLSGQTRALAMQNALLQARQLAELAGLRLGRVLSISGLVDRPGVGPLYDRAEGLGGDTSISPGEITFRVQLQVTYALE